MKNQSITSKFTSVNSKKLPAIYGRLDYSALLNYWESLTKFERTPTILDFCCCCYTDHIVHFL